PPPPRVPYAPLFRSAPAARTGVGPRQADCAGRDRPAPGDSAAEALLTHQFRLDLGTTLLERGTQDPTQRWRHVTEGGQLARGEGHIDLHRRLIGLDGLEDRLGALFHRAHRLAE